MFSIKGIPVKIFALIMAVIAIAGGAYLSFFHSAGFEKTQATIVSIEEYQEDGETRRQFTVEYTVDGQTYTRALDSDSPSYDVGKTVEVLYDPKDPGVIHSGGFFGFYLMGVGALIIAAVAVTEARKKRSLADVKAKQQAGGGADYPASRPAKARHLYFLTDLGTAKAGHRIEDQDRNVLYEAKMTKFTMIAPFGFDFIDHEHGKTTPHLVGHEEASEWDNSLIFDNHYTFTFDGEDIWKHLKRNGISVESSFTKGVRLEYAILRDGDPIAVATGSSQNVHEEDAQARSKLASLVPVKGFYRIDTTETDLSLLFVTLMAFARCGASDDEGGTRRAVWNTITK